MQKSLSAAGYWHDAINPTRYVKDASFLPYFDNLIITPNSSAYKENFLKIKKMALFGSPQDGDLAPVIIF